MDLSPARRNNAKMRLMDVGVGEGDSSTITGPSR